MTEVKPKKFKRCLFNSLLFYTVTSFAFIGATALSVKNDSTAISVFAKMLLSDLVILFLFSIVFGFSMLIFEFKNMPSAAKWTLHIVVLYASMVFAFLLMAGKSSDPSTIVKFVIISALLFAVVYSFSALGVSLYKRKKR